MKPTVIELIVIFSTERDKLSCVMDTSPLSINPSPIPPVVCYVPLTVHQCPFILMGGERHCRDERVLTKNDMAKTLGFKGRMLMTRPPHFPVWLIKINSCRIEYTSTCKILLLLCRWGQHQLQHHTCIIPPSHSVWLQIVQSLLIINLFTAVQSVCKGKTCFEF